MRSSVIIITALVLSLTRLAVGQTVSPEDSARLTSLHKRAETGDAKAQFELGFMFEGQRNFDEALKWYRKSAEQGASGAKQSIARMYYEGIGVAKDYSEAARWYGCPEPDIKALTACREVSYKDLPKGALALLKTLRCDVSSNYDYGSAVDLNGDGQPEYEVCCKDSSHGPCGAVVIGKIGSDWKELTAKEGVAGYTPACGLFVVLASRHSGVDDVCLPNQCSTVSSPGGRPCVPTIWNFIEGRYRSVPNTLIAPPR
jgi:hypothetical protein